MLEGDAINMTICSFFSWNCGVMVIAYKHKFSIIKKKKQPKKQNKRIQKFKLFPLALLSNWSFSEKKSHKSFDENKLLGEI